MKKFEVSITMIVGMSEDVHYHKTTLEGVNEFDVFQQIKNSSWFHYERTSITTTNGVRKMKKYQEFIQVKNISDICIVEVGEGVVIS